MPVRNGGVAPRHGVPRGVDEVVRVVGEDRRALEVDLCRGARARVTMDRFRQVLVLVLLLVLA